MIVGDEFAIILPNDSVLEIEQYIHNVQIKMGRVDENSPIFPIHKSIGYAYSDSSYGIMEQLLNEADA